MPQYRYTVINQENKKLAGVINAPSEAEAKQELNNLGFSVISLSEAPTASAVSDKKKFEFTAFDKKGKKIIGTIPSKDRYSGYKRLTEEYSFKVLSIYPADAGGEAKSKYQLSGVSDLENLYLEESKNKTSQEESTQKTAPKNSTIGLNEINSFIEQVQAIISQYQDKIQPNSKKAIEEQINKILRIKSSTNLDLIKDSCRDLIKLLENPELIIDQTNNSNLASSIQLEAKKAAIQINKIDHTAEPGLYFNLQSRLQKMKINSAKNPWTKKIVAWILPRLAEKKEVDPELNKLTTDLKQINQSLIDYAKIWLKSNKDIKAKIGLQLKDIWQKRADLKSQIKKSIVKTTRQTKSLNIKTGSVGLVFLKELNTFSGWLLTFYLVYYFIAEYFLTKQLSLSISWNFQAIHSGLMTYLIVLVFLLHASVSLKLLFFKQNRLANFLIFPASLFLFLLVLFNF